VQLGTLLLAEDWAKGNKLEIALHRVESFLNPGAAGFRQRPLRAADAIILAARLAFSRSESIVTAALKRGEST
jgi:hypothetical protein